MYQWVRASGRGLEVPEVLKRLKRSSSVHLVDATWGSGSRNIAGLTSLVDAVAVGVDQVHDRYCHALGLAFKRVP